MNLFQKKEEIDFALLIQKGAKIVDVRSKKEFEAGHNTHSLNIPLETLESEISSLKQKETVLIICCEGGVRSALGKDILIKNGVTQVYDGGGWKTLQGKIFKNK